MVLLDLTGENSDMFRTLKSEMGDRQITMADALENWINMLGPDQVWNHQLWEYLLQNVINHWKIKPPASSDSEPLKILIQSVINLLKTHYSTCSENHLDFYLQRLSALLSDTSQKFLSWDVVRDVGNYWIGFKEMGLISPENFMGTSKRKRTSTSCMAVPTPTEVAVVDGKTTPLSENALRSLFDKPSSSGN
ncbi:uncharacterized protein LOC129958349 isoform X2 [Argiope bruennichi]|nr:uncharacterized protein LOC129958349 isoform X2 [Argiope bruennichi]